MRTDTPPATIAPGILLAPTLLTEKVSELEMDQNAQSLRQELAKARIELQQLQNYSKRFEEANELREAEIAELKFERKVLWFVLAITFVGFLAVLFSPR